MCRSIRRATNPVRFASSTNPEGKAAPAVLLFKVPIACWTAVKLPGRILRARKLASLADQRRPQTRERIEAVGDELVERPVGRIAIAAASRV